MGICFGILGLGGWEMVLLVALALLLFGARRLPNIGQGLSEGFSQFRKHFDRPAYEAGESLGGIYGKPAAQALTPDNQTAELYDPAVFRRMGRTGGVRHGKWFSLCWRFCQMIWRSVLDGLKPGFGRR
jgi:Sec-independent protein translocase protein TatA